MAIGLAVGTGYVLFALIFTLITSLLSLVLYKTKFGENSVNDRILRIVIPEDLDYQTVFDKKKKKHLDKYTLRKVKTINMGSLFELDYLVNLNNKTNEKELIDDIRVRNGNLKISLTRDIENRETL